MLDRFGGFQLVWSTQMGWLTVAGVAVQPRGRPQGRGHVNEEGETDQTEFKCTIKFEGCQRVVVMLLCNVSSLVRLTLWGGWWLGHRTPFLTDLHRRWRAQRSPLTAWATGQVSGLLGLKRLDLDVFDVSAPGVLVWALRLPPGGV